MNFGFRGERVSEVNNDFKKNDQIYDDYAEYVDIKGRLAEITGKIQLSDSKVDTRENMEYYTTYEERLKYLPAQESDFGHWEGERGESKFIPNNEDVKKL